LVRVKTSAGVEGIGNELDDKLIGKTLGELLEVKEGRLYLRAEARGMFPPRAQAVMLDIVGKLTNRPAAELLGPIVRKEARIYDGSIYMRELDDGDSAIAADVNNSLEAGHKEMKIKIGRGNWLKDRAKGYARDLWAIRTVRQTAGKDATLMVDANNYYNLEESLRLVEDTADDPKLHWMEEMFQEVRANHDNYRKLHEAVKRRGRGLHLADGESGRGDGELMELLKEGVVQISQPDIHTLGIFAFRDYAEQVRPLGTLVAPHVWAKQIGMLETCLLGMVAANFDTVEDCRLTSEVVKFPHLRIKDGRVTLQGAPGLGLEIDEKAYAKYCRPERA
jgi:L-alanine-DL-glutamate epimerase-like enolase superfamily enzyme